MGLAEMIKSILEHEDIKNPLTDEEISIELNISREVVTEWRKNHSIANSRNRRLAYIDKDATEILLNDMKISDRNFTESLKERGYKIERFAASRIKKDIINNINQKLEVNRKDSSSKGDFIPISVKGSDSLHNNHFSNLIGFDGSLKVQVDQAKAAISYPPNGLHVLLLGPSGVGKSYLAECMYNFAKSTNNFNDNSQFVVFNCADYADNPQLLLAQLFGSVKGAYTGSTENKKGLIEVCDGGILFLDEVHRLPSEGQEILFSILDKGIYRRLGETETTRKSNVMIIAATTENVESSLLLTFRRRIPMVIEIPPIKDRPYEEKFELINQCLLSEGCRISKDILVSKEVIRDFMKYECQGNIGQLKSDIQVACAISFLENNLNESNILAINLNHISEHIKQQSMFSKVQNLDIEKFIVEDILISNKGEKVPTLEQKDNRKVSDIYKFIEIRQTELKFAGYSDEEITKILSQQVELELIRNAKAINYTNVNKEELISLVGLKSLETVRQAISLAKKDLPGIQADIIYPLAVHLNSTYERIVNGKEIVNPKIKVIKSKYEYEFEVAKKMCDLISKRLNVTLPEDEIGFITMYLKNYRGKYEDDEGKVSVIIMTHGKVASAIAEVTNKFLGVNHAIGLDMDFSDSPEVMLEKAIKLVKEADRGKGCIILVDMGSLVTFGDIITARTGIDTRIVGRVDTLMALEAVRKAVLTNLSLEKIVQDLESDSRKLTNCQDDISDEDLPRVIVTLCITGRGSALKIKEYIESKIDIKSKNINLVPIGFIDDDIITSLNEISKNKKIEAIVGTINPEFKGLPFISLEDIMKGPGIKKINNIIDNKKENMLSEIINEDVICINENYKYKDEALDKMTKKLTDGGYVMPEFLLSVFKREMLDNTYLKGGIAIPHGGSEFVTKPTILITKLANKILWSGNYEVDLIFLIALKEDSKNYFEQLYKVIRNEEVLNRIKSSVSKEEILEIIL